MKLIIGFILGSVVTYWFIKRSIIKEVQKWW